MERIYIANKILVVHLPSE